MDNKMNIRVEKNNVLMIAAGGLSLAVIIFLSVVSKTLSKDVFVPSLIGLNTGIILFVAALIMGRFVKGNHRMIFSVILYAVTLILIVVSFVLNRDIISLGDDATGASRWLKIGDFALDTAAFLPFTLILSGLLMTKAVEKDSPKSVYFVLLCVVALLPLVFVTLEPNVTPVMVICFSYVMFFLISGWPTKARIPKWIIAIPLALGVAVMALLIVKSSYLRDHFLMIFTRGKTVPSKFMDIIDSLLGGALAVGPSTSAGSTENLLLLTEHRRLELVCILGETGIIPFVLVTLCYILLFFVMFRLRKNMTPDRGFTYYGYELILCFFVCKTFYAYLSQFVLTAALSSPAFIGGETSGAAELLLLGIMFAFYLKNRSLGVKSHD